jgi:hypothetical protein
MKKARVLQDNRLDRVDHYDSFYFIHLRARARTEKVIIIKLILLLEKGK